MVVAAVWCPKHTLPVPWPWICLFLLLFWAQTLINTSLGSCVTQYVLTKFHFHLSETELVSIAYNFKTLTNRITWTGWGRGVLRARLHYLYAIHETTQLLILLAFGEPKKKKEKKSGSLTLPWPSTPNCFQDSEILNQGQGVGGGGWGDGRRQEHIFSPLRFSGQF